MKQLTILAAILCLSGVCCHAVASNSSDFLYLAQDSREIVAPSPSTELWIGGATRAPEGSKSKDIPSAITVIYLVDASQNKSRRVYGLMPEGTELKIHLTLKPDQHFQTVYVLDLRKTYSANSY